MNRILLAFLIAFALLRVPHAPSAEKAYVHIEAPKSPLAPYAYAAPIEAYTPQQTRNSSLTRRVPIVLSNPTTYDFSGAIMVSIEFPSGREPYFSDVNDPASYIVEVRDSEGNIVPYQIDTSLTVADGNNAKHLVVRIYSEIPAGEEKKVYLYFATTSVSRTPPSFSYGRTITAYSDGYKVTDGTFSYFLRTAPVKVSPTVYVIPSGIRNVSVSTYTLGAKASEPLYELFRSALIRNVFYFYNATYYENYYVYVPVFPITGLSVINPDYASNGRPYYGSAQDQAYPGAHGGYIARRLLAPSSSVIPYRDYGRAFVGALYEPTGSPTLDGSYPTDPITSDVTSDPDYRNSHGRNASFMRVNNSGTFYSYMAFSNGISTVSNPSETLYAQKSPMHAINNIREHFTAYVEFLIYAPRTAAYELSFGSDDNLRVRIDGKLAINARTLHGLTRYSANYLRRAGSRHYVQIEFAEGPSRYDLHMKIKVTDPNDPNNVYVGSQYIRLDSFALPYSRAAAPNLAAGIVSYESGPVFAKLSFKDAPVVPLRGVFPNVLDPNFDRYDISYGNLTVDYYFLPNGRIYVNYTFTPRDDLVDDLGMMPRSFDDNYVEKGITGAAPGNLLIVTGGSYEVDIAGTQSTDDGKFYGIRTSFSNDLDIIIATSMQDRTVRTDTAPLASFTDSSTNYPGDANPATDSYKQQALGIAYTGRVSEELDRDARIYLYVPNYTDDIGLVQAMIRAEEVNGEPGSVEAQNGLNVRVLDVDGGYVYNASVYVKYLGVKNVNETGIYIGHNVTDVNGLAKIHTAIFTGNYSVKIAYYTKLGWVNATYYVYLEYSDVVNGIEKTFTLEIAKIKVTLTYANGEPIEGPISGVKPNVTILYNGSAVDSYESFSFSTDYLPASYNYTINATIDIYGYPVKKIARLIPADGSSVQLSMDVMPLIVSVYYYDGYTGTRSPIGGAPVILTLPGNVQVSMNANLTGVAVFPIVPTTNVTITSNIVNPTRGPLSVSKSVIVTSSTNSFELDFVFRRLTLRVINDDAKPVASVKVNINDRVSVYTNATGYAIINVPDSSYYGPLHITARYVEYSYLQPVVSISDVYLSVNSNLIYILSIPMRDITVTVTDIVGTPITKIYHIKLISSVAGLIYDGYASGPITFKNMYDEASFNLSVIISIDLYGYNITVTKNINYVPIASNTTVKLPIAMLTVHVLYAYPDHYEPVSEVVVDAKANDISASATTDDEGVAKFVYLPLSLLVGDYNVSVSVDVLGVEAFESKIVTLDQPREIYLYIELKNVAVDVSKANGESVIASVKVYLDSKLATEELINGSGTIVGLPLKYVSNATFVASYETPYGLIVSSKAAFTGLQLLALLENSSVSLSIPVASLSVTVETSLTGSVTLYLGQMILSASGTNVTFEDVPYGNRTIKIELNTLIAPVAFNESITVDEPSLSYAFVPPLSEITIEVVKPSGSITAEVMLTYGMNSITLKVPGSLTLEEMPRGNYSYRAVHITPYGLPVSVSGTFSVVDANESVQILFELADVKVSLAYSGGYVSGTVTLYVNKTAISAYGSNVTFVEIPYGTRNVSVEYTNVATIIYLSEIHVSSPYQEITLYLPVADVTLEVKNAQGAYVRAMVSILVISDTNGSISLDVVGKATLKAMPRGTYFVEATYTTPYGVPVSAFETFYVNSSDTLTVVVPSGEYRIEAYGENGKPVPLASVRIEFSGYTSIYEGSLANGSITLSDFPYGVNIKITLNGTFHGYHVRKTVSVKSSPEGIKITMPLKDITLRIIDQDTGEPASGATVRLYFNASGNMLLVASGVTDENGSITFERVPSEEFMSSIYGEGFYVAEVEYKGGTFYIKVTQNYQEEAVNPPIPRTHIAIAVLAIALALASSLAYYYKRRTLGPYHRLKSAIAKGEEAIDLERLPTREEELEELYRELIEGE